MKLVKTGLELLLTCFCVLTFASCADHRRSDGPGGDTRHFEKKFTVASGGSLVLRTDVGSVSVRGGDGNEVNVVVDIRGRERDVNRFDLKTEQQGNDVHVVGDLRERGGSWFSGINNFDARFVITVPREYNVELKTSGGDLLVAAIKGKVNGETSGGNVKAEQIEGDVAMETSGGDVHAEKVSGAVRMATSGGDVHAVALVGDVEMRTSGGNVTIDGVDGAVQARTSGGNVEIRLVGSNRGVHAETSGGNIDVGVARNVAADLDLSTSGGEVTCDMPVTVSGRIREDNIRGTVNGGGPSIYAHTSGGNVRVRPL